MNYQNKDGLVEMEFLWNVSRLYLSNRYTLPPSPVAVTPVISLIDLSAAAWSFATIAFINRW